MVLVLSLESSYVLFTCEMQDSRSLAERKIQRGGQLETISQPTDYQQKGGHQSPGPAGPCCVATGLSAVAVFDGALRVGFGV